MKKEYHYRPHLRWAQYIFPIFFGGILLCIGAIWITEHEPPFSESFLIGGILTGVLGLEGGLGWWICYRLTGIRVTLDETALEYTNRHQEIHIPFETIRYLEFPSASYFGGWIKILTPQHTIRLTAVLEHIGDFLQTLKAAIDQHGNTLCYNRKAFFRFYKTAVYVEHNSERLYAFFWKLLAMTVLTILIGIGFSQKIHLGIAWSVSWGIFSFSWPVLVYWVVEFLFMRQFAKHANEDAFTCPSRDVRAEKQIYWKAILWGILIYGAIAVLVIMSV